MRQPVVGPMQIHEIFHDISSITACCCLKTAKLIDRTGYYSANVVSLSFGALAINDVVAAVVTAGFCEVAKPFASAPTCNAELQPFFLQSSNLLRPIICLCQFGDVLWVSLQSRSQTCASCTAMSVCRLT